MNDAHIPSREAKSADLCERCSGRGYISTFALGELLTLPCPACVRVTTSPADVQPPPGVIVAALKRMEADDG